MALGTQTLRRHADFRRLWAGHTVSLLGSQVTFLALPFVAVSTLGATPFQMGLLGAAGALPALLFGLVVGVGVDRWRRRPLMVLADLGRGLLLLAIPLAALFDALRLEWVYAVAFLVGALSLLFEVAAQSLLPALIPRAWLVEGNSRLETSRSAAEIVGPGLGGGLIGLVTAPFAILADALSFFLSALLVAGIRAPEPPPKPTGSRPRIGAEIGEGLRWVLRHPLLRPLAGASALLTFSNSALEAVFLLYLVRALGLSPALIGIVFSVGSVGLLLGAVAAEPVARRLGAGPALIAAVVTVGLADLIVPLASGATLVIGAALIAAQFCFGLGLLVYNITAVSLRQGATPDRLQGRMHASMRFLAQGLTPLGALLGGLLGQRLGLRETLFLAVGGELLAALWLLASPHRSTSGFSP